MKSLNIRIGAKHILVHYVPGETPDIEDVICAVRLTDEEYAQIDRAVLEYEEQTPC